MGTALLALACAITAARAQEPKDVEDVLQSFNGELQKGIRTAPKDPSTRTRLIAASKAIFDQEMKSATLKAPRSKWDSHQQYIENLIAAEKRYGDADTKAERVAWLTASKVILQYRLTHANEPPGDKLTTDDVFNELYTAVDKVRKDFPSAGSADVRTLGYSTAKQIFSDRLATARASARDPQSSYTQHLIKIDKDYPLPQAAPPPSQASAAPSSSGKSPPKSSGGGGGSSSPVPEKKETDFHSEPNAVLKSGAKATFDRALSAPKQ